MWTIRVYFKTQALLDELFQIFDMHQVMYLNFSAHVSIQICIIMGTMFWMGPMGDVWNRIWCGEFASIVNRFSSLGTHAA